MTNFSFQVLRPAFFPGLLHPIAGGAARSACLQAASLASRGMAVRVDGLAHARYPARLMDFSLANCDVRVHAVTRPGPAGTSPSLLASLSSSLDRVDVVHLNGGFNCLNYRIATLCRSRGVPYIVSTRSTLHPATMGHFPASVRRRLSELQRIYLDGALRLHCTSQLEIESLGTAGATRPSLLIPNAVDLVPFLTMPDARAARLRLGIPDRRFALLFLGRLVSEKQPAFLLEVIARMAPESNAFLYFVGEATPEAAAALRATARARGVHDNIRIEPHADHAKRLDWLAACDLFLLPSVAENFSLALVEAAAAGLRCLISPAIGAAEYLAQGDYIELAVEPSAWARTCERIAVDQRVRDREVVGRLLERLAPTTVADAWLQRYQELGLAPSGLGIGAVST